MSSSTHLICLTFLRDTLKANRPILFWRLTGMCVLSIMLLVSLIPTTSGGWSYASMQMAWGGIPARCFWQSDAFKDMSDFDEGSVSIIGVISMILLVVSYTWKISSLFKSSQIRVYALYRGYPEYYLERALVWTVHVRFGKPFYKVVLAGYVLLQALYEFGESFCGSLYFLTATLLWGTLEIGMPRFSNTAKGIHSGDLGENSMGFGQIVPLVLLVLPVAAIFEHFAVQHKEKAKSHEDKNDDVEFIALQPVAGSVHIVGSGSVTASPGAGAASIVSVAQSTPTTPPLPPRPSTNDNVDSSASAPSATTLNPLLGSATASPRATPSTSTQGTRPGKCRLSSLFKTLQPTKPSFKHTASRQNIPNATTESHRALIHSSRFFLVLVWILQFCVVGAAVSMYVVVGYYWGYVGVATTEIEVLYYIVLALSITLPFVMAVGMCSSSVFR